MDGIDEILATGKHVVIIGGGDTGRRLPGHLPPAEGQVRSSVGDHAPAAARALPADSLAALAAAVAH